MSIKELRQMTGLSQVKFAHKFDIPVANIQNWEQGIRKPPEYVVSMLQKLMQYEGYEFKEES